MPLLLSTQALAQEDLFNYDRTVGKSYGPEDWDEVSCNRLETCVSTYYVHSSEPPGDVQHSDVWYFSEDRLVICTSEANRP